MTKLTPYLLFDGSCAEAMKFYQPAKCIKFCSPMHRRANFAFLHLAGYMRGPLRLVRQQLPQLARSMLRL